MVVHCKWECSFNDKTRSVTVKYLLQDVLFHLLRKFSSILRHFFKEKRLCAFRCGLLVHMFSRVAKCIEQSFGAGFFLLTKNLNAAFNVNVSSLNGIKIFG